MSKALPLPDFSNIVFLPIGQQAKVNNPDEKTNLLKFFNVVINREKLEVDEQQLEQIFCQDLTIDTKKLDKRLLAVLGEALIYYMTVWPGWQRGTEYYNGKLPLMEWYERFRQYLIFKSNFIIKNVAKFSTDTHSETSTKNAEIQTQVSEMSKSGEKKIAPYVLSIGAPPSVLNNIVFMESNGNVLIKQHLEKQWQPLKIKEFLNWLHVSVDVNLPDIFLTRSNTHKIERYIALCGDLTLLPDVNHINYIKKTSNDAEMQPYSFEFFYCYFQQYFQLLKKVPGINAHRLQELDAIFIEFLADIQEIKVYNCTMCTDIAIGYHVGKCKYIRNKKMVSSDAKTKPIEPTTINFYEILIPQIDFTLHHFKAVQEVDAPTVTFKNINNILKLISADSSHADLESFRKMINNTCLVYKCTLCSESFSDAHAYFKLTQHFSKNHKAEQALLCFKCRQEFTVKALAGQRWRHKCVEPNKMD